MRKLVGLAGCLVVSLVSLSVQAAPPQIGAQGVLRNPEGGLLEGDVTLTFRIYATQEAEQPLWSEPQIVSVTAGLFNALLPADPQVVPFPEDIFADGGVRWLAIEPQGEAELPRTQVVSVAYALQANTALLANGLSCNGCIGQDHLAATAVSAVDVAYDNAFSGMASQNAQDALDETAANVTGHSADPDAHHSAASDGLAITPSGIAIKGTSTALSDGLLDLGPEATDSLSAAQLQTLTGGVESNADALHAHAGSGGGGTCYTAWGTTECGPDFDKMYDGTAFYPVFYRLNYYQWGYSQSMASGVGDALCMKDVQVDSNYDSGNGWLFFWATGRSHGSQQNVAQNQTITCAVCCK